MEIRAAVVDPVGRNAYWSANVSVSGGVRKAGYRYCRMIRRSETLDSTEVTKRFKCLFQVFLFLIYINDLDLGVDNDLLKFADDTKLFGAVTNRDKALSVQKDLNVLTRWTSQWQMQFNVPKCSVMHLGNSNIQFTYAINGQALQQVEAQSDLGVMFRNDLKASDQCVKSYAKASRVLGMIGRNIRYKSPDVMLRLYCKQSSCLIALLTASQRAALSFISPHSAHTQAAACR